METLIASKPHVHFEVEKVIGISKDGTYQVQWAPMWVSSFHLRGCEHLIQDFLKQQSSKHHESLHEGSGSSEYPNQQSSLQLESIQCTGTSVDSEPSENTMLGYHTQTDFDNQHIENDFIDESPSHTMNSTRDANSEHSLGDEPHNNSDDTFDTFDDDSIVIVKMEDQADNHYFHDQEMYGDLNPPNESTENTMQQQNYDSSNTSSPTLAFRKHHTDSGKKRYTCTHCGSFWSRKPDLERHQMDVHGEKPYKCDTCQKTFTTNSHLKRHLKIHSGDKPRYACPICSKSFSRSDDLKAHIKTHKGMQPFGCDVCERRFSRRDQWRNHRCVNVQSKPPATDMVELTSPF